jgi:hypothetical protein
MIAVKDAVASAMAFAKELLGTERASRLQLEEVEESATLGGSEKWLITLSMPATNAIGFLGNTREYKTFTVDGQTGKVLSMKIRQLADAG